MKKYIISALIIVVAVAMAMGIYFYIKKPAEAVFKTARVEKGDIVSAVSATGNLAAVGRHPGLRDHTEALCRFQFSGEAWTAHCPDRPCTL
jgi:multidrug efflux pump subunit AcrA (membrane-fusion protein)